MSVCTICHVPYTKRDIYALNLTPYIRREHPKQYSNTMAQSPPRGRRPALPVIPTTHGSPFSSESSGAVEDGYGMTVPALLQRIRDLEAAVGHRDGQIHEWKRQFDKNAQALLMHLREIRELKQEFRDKDLEVQTLRRTLAERPPVKAQSPPLSPARKHELDGSRVVSRTRLEVPQVLRRTSNGIRPRS
ncbi:hypothetical protein DL93DRAFT_2074167 [Clavulina sp. PMI_390]|nr:hypothetical protein DL93DRAFT_2074167 [Clavulina sp. PMI_390]